MESDNREIFVYQLRVWLREISLAIWRRLLVRSDSTIADLHYTLQIAMGWTDFHLHQFRLLLRPRFEMVSNARYIRADNSQRFKKSPCHSFVKL